MKALEILNKYRKEQEWLLNSIKQSLPHRDIRIINNDIESCNEAIEELEALENRCCDNCEHYNETQTCNKFIARSGYSHKDFYCNKWESE